MKELCSERSYVRLLLASLNILYASLTCKEKIHCYSQYRFEHLTEFQPENITKKSQFPINATIRDEISTPCSSFIKIGHTKFNKTTKQTTTTVVNTCTSLPRLKKMVLKSIKVYLNKRIVEFWFEWICIWMRLKEI